LRRNPFRWRGECAVVLTLMFAGCVAAHAAPVATLIGPGLYAYISDNDASANSTFLVGERGILVVDAGLNAAEGNKLLQAIRAISALPILYVINTHYHPDHQGGNSTVGPAATVISTDFTRERSLALSTSAAMPDAHSFHPAELTFQHKLTIHLEPYSAELFFSGKAHTSGDALVYFPQQHAISMGDLFLNRCSPAMDQGSAENWIHILDQVLTLPINAAVPGHFELGTRADLQRFRDYMNDLFAQVRTLRKNGATAEQVRRQIHMEKYSDFRQYPKYEATFADNAETMFRQMGHP
jgi:cyclase